MTRLIAPPPPPAGGTFPDVPSEVASGDDGGASPPSVG